VEARCAPFPYTGSDGTVANRSGRGSGWEIAHAVVLRCLPISLYMVVARTHMYTFGICPPFKEHFLSPRAKPQLTLRSRLFIAEDVSVCAQNPSGSIWALKFTVEHPGSTQPPCSLRRVLRPGALQFEADRAATEAAKRKELEKKQREQAVSRDSSSASAAAGSALRPSVVVEEPEEPEAEAGGLAGGFGKFGKR
jgi:hypothetical protein